jgi:hypothetical protein
MRKLLIVPAIVAFASMSGGAFAQGVHTTAAGVVGGTIATGSPVAVAGSPNVGVNVGIPIQASILTANNSQRQTLQQGNTQSIGIGGAQSFITH